jgi:isopentenyl phosphate kinase
MPRSRLASLPEEVILRVTAHLPAVCADDERPGSLQRTLGSLRLVSRQFSELVTDNWTDATAFDLLCVALDQMDQMPQVCEDLFVHEEAGDNAPPLDLSDSLFPAVPSMCTAPLARRAAPQGMPDAVTFASASIRAAAVAAVPRPWRPAEAPSTYEGASYHDFAFAMLAACGDMPRLRAMIRAAPRTGLNPNFNDDWAFRLAALYGRRDVVELLLSLGNPRVDVSAVGSYALRGSCENGFVDVARLLVNLPRERRPKLDDEDGTIELAASKNRAGCIAELLKLNPGPGPAQGGPVSDWITDEMVDRALHIATVNAHVESLRALLTFDPRATAARLIATNGGGGGGGNNNSNNNGGRGEQVLDMGPRRIDAYLALLDKLAAETALEPEVRETILCAVRAARQFWTRRDAKSQRWLVVKIGGAGITRKARAGAGAGPNPEAAGCGAESSSTPSVEHDVNHEALDKVARALHSAWTERAGVVVIHGAGCFGHRTAKAGGLHLGLATSPSLSSSTPSSSTSPSSSSSSGSSSSSLHSSSATPPTSRAAQLLAWSRTAREVRLLNLEVVRALCAEGMPAVPISPFPQWTTHGGGSSLDREAARHITTALAACHERGLVPVLHGDVAADADRGCAILSGDTLAEAVVAILTAGGSTVGVDCVFLTDVPGVLPTADAAEETVLPIVAVDPLSGQVHVPVSPSSEGAAAATGGADSARPPPAEIEIGASLDCTGGMAGKLAAAGKIAAHGATVRIARAGVDANAAFCGKTGTVVIAEES